MILISRIRKVSDWALREELFIIVERSCGVNPDLPPHYKKGLGNV